MFTECLNLLIRSFLISFTTENHGSILENFRNKKLGKCDQKRFIIAKPKNLEMVVNENLG